MRVGERPNKNLASGYESHPMHAFAEAFTQITESISETADLFLDARRAVNSQHADAALKNFFIEQSCDEEHMTPEQIEEHYDDMEALYMNDREGLLEHAVGNEISPVIGMAFPLHKWILMNMVFDKGGIPKVVAQSPKFTISQETRILIDTNGREIDMFKEQNEMTKAIDATIQKTRFEVTLPLTEDTEIVHDKVGGLAGVDHLAIETRICAVQVEDVYFEIGDLLPNDEGFIDSDSKPAQSAQKANVWVPVNFLFTPGYQGADYDRVLTRRFAYKHKTLTGGSTVEETTTMDGISGTMKNDRINLNTLGGKIKKVMLEAALDPSNARATTCSVSWRADTQIVEIGNAIPINTTISPEEVKDISALYNVNQVTKIMSLMKTVLGNYKDDKIHENLDASYKTLDTRSKTYNQFDFSPRVGYAGDHVQWRRDTFLDFLDSEVTTLLQALNDPNMTVSIYGDPDLVRKITPTNYQFQSPGSIGPVELDYTKLVYTSDKRVYQFIGSDKLRGTTEFIIVLCPNGTDRILYRIYDYQLYLSNEIRNANNPALPALHSFERWKFVEYTPVQGRINILNPRGINAATYNAFPTKAV